MAYWNAYDEKYLPSKILRSFDPDSVQSIKASSEALESSGPLPAFSPTLKLFSLSLPVDNSPYNTGVLDECDFNWP